MSRVAMPDKAEKTEKRAKQSAKSPSGGFQDYLKGVRSEWGKISWPTWPQIWGQTIVVLVMVSIMTFALYIIDHSFIWTIEHITPKRI